MPPARRHANEHERSLYNTLQFQLEQAMRSYLSRTQQLDPIYFVFDMSNLH